MIVAPHGYFFSKGDDIPVVTFTNAAGQKFEATIPFNFDNDAVVWESGYMYVYEVTLKDESAVITGTIEPWKEGKGGEIDAERIP